ncbi:MAG: hypothetical protein KIT73_07905 [Burkholderiales bacterium]|nr:hypothetical protein [Burkholderiales bacterium]
MTQVQIAVILALSIYALYRQTQRHEVIGNSRFKLALIYAIVGVASGGFAAPVGPLPWAFTITGIVLSAGIGIARGRLTRVWKDPDGHVYSKGTPLTIALFLSLVVAKFGMGAYENLQHEDSNGRFGEVLVLIAIMVALQAEIIWRRARPLGALRNKSGGAG